MYYVAVNESSSYLPEFASVYKVSQEQQEQEQQEQQQLLNL